MAVEVVLLKDVERVGAEGAIVRVAPGFARNFLLPRGLAAVATPQRVAAAEAVTRQRARKAQRAQQEAETLKRRIESQPLQMTLTLGADDKPFGSVTAHDLWQALRRAGVAIEKHAIRLDHPLKSLGVFDIPVKVHPTVEATLNVWVGKA